MLLARALALAEPQGYVRLFVDEGPPMADLLQAAAEAGVAPGYVQRLLGTMGEAAAEMAAPPKGGDRLSAGPAQTGVSSPIPPPAPMLEPLSERELQVLRLLGTDLSGPEIASALFVSLNTLRTHTKNVYGKLGVNSRRAAVRRGEELALL